jgi:hypothetical protein
MPTGVRTPFLDVLELPPSPAPALKSTAVRTPFVSEYHAQDRASDGSAEVFEQLLAELHDSQFDAAVAELAEEADAYAELLGAGEADSDRARAERTLLHWMEPLRAEVDSLLDSMADATRDADPQLVSEAELGELLDRFEPAGSGLSPTFEDFLRSVWNKAKSVARSAVRHAGKILPVGRILARLKPLIRPLLTRVLQRALDHLPASLRPAAAELAKRFLGPGVRAEMGEAVDETESPASADLRGLQAELDSGIATLLLTQSEPQLELLLAVSAADNALRTHIPLAELDRARDALVAGLGRLEEGEDPTPLVEQFLPAILPALRIGIQVVGRGKVVAFLARYLGRLIAPLVGPTITPPLSAAIVDAGLRLLTLEAPGEPPERSGPDVAAEALTALMEDVVTEVARLSDDELDQLGVVEESAYEAFHRAAATHFPPVVLREQRPGPGGVWVGMPRHGPRKYLKYSRVVDVVVSPEAAAAIRIRGGRMLATFLRDRLGRDGPVRARLHLFQAVPGTREGRIARAERRSTPGAATPAGTAAAEQLAGAAGPEPGELHPLTTQAAALLAGESGLGRDVSDEYLDEYAPLAVGQRLYYLEVPGGRPPVTGRTRSGRTERPRMSGATAAVDPQRGQLTVAVYLGEARAQSVAVRLRRKEPLGATLTAIRRVYGSTPLVPPIVRRWVRLALAEHLPKQRDAFLAAAAAPEDGLTLLLRMTKPPGLAALAAALRDAGSARSSAPIRGLTQGRPESTQLEIVAGHRHV